MATGEVILHGTVGGNDAGYGGFEPSKAFDRDTTTAWASLAGTGCYIGIDLGVGVTRVITQVRIAPRPSANDNIDYERNVWGGHAGTALLFGSNTSLTADRLTLKSLSAADKWFRRNHCTNVAVAVIAACRYFGYANDSGGDIGELQFIASASSGAGTAASRPLEAAMSMTGGRFASAAPVSVTLSCRTTSATIFYTTDGTTPAHTAGVPSGTTQTYTGAISIAPTAAGVVLKTLAYDATCSITDSDVATSAPFIIQAFGAKQTWYQSGDLTGFSMAARTIEAHAASIKPPSQSLDGYYHMFGHASDCTNRGNNPGFIAMTHYRSTDAVNWTLVDIAVSMEALDVRSDEGDFGVRPCPIWSAALSTWVMWIKGYDADHASPDSTAYIYTSDSGTLNGPWTLFSRDSVPTNSPRAYDTMSDFTIFEDTDGKAYIFASAKVAGVVYMMCQELDADRTGCTGTGIEFAAGATAREAPVCYKRNGNYFLHTSETNYYDSITDVFDQRYIVGTGGTTPLNASWTAMDGSLLFGSTIAANSDWNGQSSCIVEIPGVGPVLMMDWWTQSYNFESYYTWVPLTFPTDTTTRGSQAEWTIPTSAGVGRTRRIAHLARVSRV